MKASEAKRISDEAIASDGIIKSWLDPIYEKIEAAAKKGETSLSHPLNGMAPPNNRQKTAIWEELQRQGYKVEYFQPDQRDPRDSGYTTIKW